MISRNAALSGVSSGGRLSQARAVISSEPKLTVLPTGISSGETRAAILSSACRTTISYGSARAADAAIAAARAQTAAPAPSGRRRRLATLAGLVVRILERRHQLLQHI